MWNDIVAAQDDDTSPCFFREKLEWDCVGALSMYLGGWLILSLRKNCEDLKFIALAALSPHNFPTHMFLLVYVALQHIIHIRNYMWVLRRVQLP